jgi:ABC-type glycerol-3-phosphate transport system substrate-binding protein
MNIGIIQNYITFLYQMGGSLYKDGNTASNLDAKEALDAFNYMMNFYIAYNVPVSYNFVQRFRTGEMPIAVDDISAYNSIRLTAPEINGQWEMTHIPGFLAADGSVNNVGALGTAGAILLAASKYKDNAWEFIKWYTDSDAQYMFGSQLESILGVGARYNTANLEALGRLPWTVSEKKALFSQIDKLQGTPQVPGGYMTTRSLGFATTLVYTNNADPRETMLSYIPQMTQEIELKRREFGLD